MRNGIGGTGVIGVLDNWNRAPVCCCMRTMDALPVEEATGLDYASAAHDQGPPIGPGSGDACLRARCAVTALLGAAQLLADGADHWDGTVVR